MTIFLPITDQYSQMGDIHAQCFANAWSQTTFRDMFEDSSQYSGQLIMHEAKLVGFVICSQMIDEAEIITICIVPNLRGRGLGDRLLRHQINLLTQAKVKKLFLEVDENNLSATKLYQNLGFAQRGLRKNYYKLANGNRSDALIFSLDL